MHNYSPDSVATVYGWFRSGDRTGRKGDPGKPWRLPGASARKMHAKPSRKEGVSSWQGFFLRAIPENPDASLPRVHQVHEADPWATSKSA